MNRKNKGRRALFRPEKSTKVTAGRFSRIPDIRLDLRNHLNMNREETRQSHSSSARTSEDRRRNKNKENHLIRSVTLSTPRSMPRDEDSRPYKELDDHPSHSRSLAELREFPNTRDSSAISVDKNSHSSPRRSRGSQSYSPQESDKGPGHSPISRDSRKLQSVVKVPSSRNHKSPDSHPLRMQRRDRQDSPSLPRDQDYSNMLKRHRSSTETNSERRKEEETIPYKRERHVYLLGSTNESMPNKLASASSSSVPHASSQKTHRHSTKEGITTPDYSRSPEINHIQKSPMQSKNSLLTQASHGSYNTLQQVHCKLEKKQSVSTQRRRSPSPGRERTQKGSGLTNRSLSEHSSSSFSSNTLQQVHCKREKEQSVSTQIRRSLSPRRERTQRGSTLTSKSLPTTSCFSSNSLQQSEKEQSVSTRRKRSPTLKREYDCRSPKRTKKSPSPQTFLSKLPSHKDKYHEVKKEKGEPRRPSLARSYKGDAHRSSKRPKSSQFSPQTQFASSRSESGQRGRSNCHIKKWSTSLHSQSPLPQDSRDHASARTLRTDETQTFKPLGYKALQEICSLEKDKAMTEIIRMKGRYTALLNSAEAIREDLFSLVIESLLLILKSLNRPTEMSEIIRNTSKQLLKHHFQHYFTTCENSRENEYFLKVVTILKIMVQLNEDVVDDLGGILYQISKLRTEHAWQPDDEITKQFQLLESLYQYVKQPRSKKDSSDAYEVPPNDFRKLSVVPTNEEFKSVEKPYLRPNVIGKAYSSVDHYLDVQFRLLREDCFLPMRDNIRNMRLRERTEEDHKISFLFRAVRILHPVCSRFRWVYTVQLDLQRCRLQHIKWERWKRLTYGSLVCLSRDSSSFENVVFATVENRDISNLKYGLVDLRFQNCDAIAMKEFIDKGTVFQMMENEAFFEAYKHNLTVLQTMNDENFPFKEYIVYCNKEIDPPKYLGSLQVSKYNDHSGMDPCQSSAMASSVDGDGFDGDNNNDGHDASDYQCDDDYNHGLDSSEEETSYVGRRSSNDKRSSSPNSLTSVHSKVPKFGPSKWSDLPSTSCRRESLNVFDSPRPSTSTAGVAKEERNRNSRPALPFIHSRFQGNSSSSDSEKSSDDEGESPNTFSTTRDHLKTNGNYFEIRHQADICFENEITSPEDDHDSHSEDGEYDESQEDVQDVLLDFSSIVNNDDLRKNDVDTSKIPALNFNRWPTKEMLGLDVSQYRAFHLALTKRFALIQGPPGTGKTYVGLKIAQVLLDSMKSINNGNRSPILMVSYTNHALDQFLMGIKSREGIVRVGGRSKEEKLNECNLRVLRQKLRKTEFKDQEIARERGRLWRESKEFEQDYQPRESSNILKESYKGVISLSVLVKFMNQQHYQYFERRDADNDSERPNGDSNLLEWLKVERKDKNDKSTKKDKQNRERMFDNEDFRRITDRRVFDEEDDQEFSKTSQEGQGQFSTLPKCKIICYPHESTEPNDLYNQLKSHFHMTEYRESQAYELLSLPVKERWKLYRLWRYRLQQLCQGNIYHCQDEGYEDVLQKLYDVGRDEDMAVLRKAKVIGMTTTCAAKNRDLLQRIRPKIVLIEEAAEVLEAHILTSIPLDCEHVILIGDHQQLRPNCNVYELSKEYNLSISMFERLVKQGIPCERLSVQHRMRPEIASLMRHIYINLENHQSVETFENVRGIEHNLYFIHHSHEETTMDEFSTSYVNEYEVTFLTKLCRFILQQGYDASSVTVLTPYVGQMFALREGLCNEGGDLKNVRISTIDNFQGEENDVILLSLVRSNQDNRAGFVNDINRACVALSRAREGLYVIGNFDVMTSKSKIWKDVVKNVEGKECFGKTLTLACQRHGTKILIEKPEDFLEKARSGGCNLPCLTRLTCGHTCIKNCHPEDTEHSRCIERCLKIICENEHQCPKICGETCVTSCAEKIDKILPCSHTKKQARCSSRIEDLKCDELCQEKLKCGHQCQSRCSQPCTRDCMELVKHYWSCGHTATAACSATPFDCSAPCGLLECNHVCSGKCGECLQGRVHKPCKSKCGRTLVCSHVCDAICSTACPPCKKTCQSVCSHNLCGQSCGEVCVPCKHDCDWQCKHFKCTRPCAELCDRPRCNKPCRKIIRECNHKCRGLCGETCICVRCHREKIEDFSCCLDENDFDRKSEVRFLRLEDCGHICEVNAIDRWVDMAETDEDSNVQAIQLKSCPVCRTPIRKTMRYNNIIKQRLADIERVKKIIVEKHKPTLSKQALKAKLVCYQVNIGNDTRHKRDCDFLGKQIEKTRHSELVMVENKVNLLTSCKELMEKVQQEAMKSNHRNAGEFSPVFNTLKYLCTKRITHCKLQREVDDVNLEIRRQNLCFQLTILQQEITRAEKEIQQEDADVLSSISTQLSKGTKIEENQLEELLEEIQHFRSKYNLSKLTQEEKISIVRAMGLSKGHWFKCPQGHIYAIGECGGAMQKSVCPECKADIGGANHKLVDGNELATEMDGARYAAWSEQANMENYEILDEV